MSSRWYEDHVLSMSFSYRLPILGHAIYQLWIKRLALIIQGINFPKELEIPVFKGSIVLRREKEMKRIMKKRKRKNRSAYDTWQARRVALRVHIKRR